MILSERLKKFIRRGWEKIVGTWNEGPEPPDRFADMVIYFANSNPQATRLDWARFATEMCRETYRTGYIRGLENAERDPEDAGDDPDAIADEFDPNWRMFPVDPRDPRNPFETDGGITLESPEDVVPELFDEDKLTVQQLERDFGGNVGPAK